MKYSNAKMLTMQRNVQELSDTLLNVVNTLNRVMDNQNNINQRLEDIEEVMDNQNNINKRLEDIEKLTSTQETLRAVRGCEEQEQVT